MVGPQNFVGSDVNAVPCLGTGEDEIWMARKEKQSTQEFKHRWSEHTMNCCLAGHILSKFFTRFYTPMQNDLWLWLTDRPARSLQHFFATASDAKCFSGPTESLKFFPSFWTWAITEILGDFMNRVFIELGERRKENGVQPMTQSWPCLFCGLGRRWSTDNLEVSLHCQRAVEQGRKALVNGGAEQLQAGCQSLLWSWDRVIAFSVHFSSKNEADPCGTTLQC